LSSENIAAQPKAKRQRLPLTEATFVNPGVDANEQQQQPAEPDVADEPATRSKTRKASSAKPRVEDPENHQTPRRELNIRAKKTKHGDRAANKGDGSLVLVRVFPARSRDHC
jgi:nuclear pore complex protein Nup133